MRGGTLLKNWPVGVVVLVATGISLAAGAGGGSMTGGSSRYPVRVALPAERAPTTASLMTLDSAAAPTPAPSATEAPAPAIVSPDFASAFAGLDTPSAAPAPRPSPAATSHSGGVAAVRFNLADPYATGGGAAPIEVKKSVRVNGADVGDATIRVTDGATIAIARDELGRILSAAGRGDAAEALAKGGTYVTFDRIRQAGLSVRYDAASDRIVLAS